MHIEIKINAEDRVAEKAARLIQQTFKENMGASYWSINITTPNGGAFRYHNDSRPIS